MRKIKFRAWDNWKKQMIQPREGDFIAWHAPSNWDECYSIMQYTGVEDKNKQEIYEGDLTSQGEVVVYEDGVFGTTYAANRQGVARLSSKRCEHMEIVGNIYQNPELASNEN